MTVLLFQRRICTCENPVIVSDPRLKDCRRCLGKVESLTNDENVAAFFTRLAETLFKHNPLTGELMTSEAWDTFTEHCQQRERAGRDTFGNRFMERDNLEDAREEAADLALYLLLDSLREVLNGGVDRDIDLALTGALYAFRAYETTLQLHGKRHADAGPGWDWPDPTAA